MPDTPLNAFYDSWNNESKRMGDMAFAKTLAALNQTNLGPQGGPPQQGPPPQGMPPQGGTSPMGMSPQQGMMPPQGGMPAGAGGPPPASPQQGGQPPAPGGMGGLNSGRPPQMGMPPSGGGSPQGPMPQMPPQGMPPGGPQPPGGGQGLDWRTIIQKVQQANPGAPPNVLAAAVDRFLPIMSQQSQMQWREQSLMIREQALQQQLMIQQERLGQGDRRLDQGDQKISQQRETAGLPPQAPPGGQYTPQQVASAQPQEPGEAGPGRQPQAQPQGEAARIGQAIIDGKQPPDFKGLYRMAPAVRAYLADHGFDLPKAQLEYKKAEKLIQSLDGPQQVRFQALAKSVDSTINEVRSLSQQMNQSGLMDLNRIKLEGLMRAEGNSSRGQLAARYLGAVNTLKEEFANLANGGYAPTEAVWALANRQINENYGVKQIAASLGEVQRLIRYRVDAQNSMGGGNLGPNAPNRYTGQSQQPSQPQQGGGNFNERFQGLPEGWSVEEH